MMMTYDDSLGGMGTADLDINELLSGLDLNNILGHQHEHVHDPPEHIERHHQSRNSLLGSGRTTGSSDFGENADVQLQLMGFDLAVDRYLAWVFDWMLNSAQSGRVYMNEVTQKFALPMGLPEYMTAQDIFRYDPKKRFLVSSTTTDASRTREVLILNDQVLLTLPEYGEMLEAWRLTIEDMLRNNARLNKVKEMESSKVGSLCHRPKDLPIAFKLLSVVEHDPEGRFFVRRTDNLIWIRLSGQFIAVAKMGGGGGGLGVMSNPGRDRGRGGPSMGSVYARGRGGFPRMMHYQGVDGMQQELALSTQFYGGSVYGYNGFEDDQQAYGYEEQMVTVYEQQQQHQQQRQHSPPQTLPTPVVPSTPHAPNPMSREFVPRSFKVMQEVPPEATSPLPVPLPEASATDLQSADFFHLWFHTAFTGFPTPLVESFLEKFAEQGFVTLHDLYLAKSLDQLSFDYLKNEIGFKMGHYNRLFAALATNTAHNK